MKVSVILASFNRPYWVRQAIKSVADQTYKDYQLVVIDESNIMDIHEVVKEFKLTEVVVRKNLVAPDQRSKTNRLSMNINEGLKVATGDLICYLADDDYYYPTWFEQAVTFFKSVPQVGAAFGKLVYSNSREMEFITDPAPVNLRFFNEVLSNPFDKLDHNQAMHKRFDPPLEWSENLQNVGGPDAYFFRDVSKTFPFYPIQTFAAVKRVHSKNLQSSLKEYYAGKIDGSRE
jgi:spore maturation protein CgeD